MRALIALIAMSVALLSGCGGAANRAAVTLTPPDATVTPGAKPRPPRFEGATIVVLSGVDRAYVRYTVIGYGDNQYASLDQIKAVGDDGRRIKWRHQTATGGPSEIVASEGRIKIGPGSRSGGDADYFDVLDLGSTKTVTVTFYFPSGPVVVPFKIAQAGQL